MTRPHANPAPIPLRAARQSSRGEARGRLLSVVAAGDAENRQPSRPEAPHEAAWSRLRPLLREIVDARGAKAVAADLGITDAALLHALAGRDRHYLRAEHLIALLQAERGLDALAELADACGCEVTPRRALTDAEALERVLAAVHELAPGIEGAVRLAGGMRMPPRRAR